MKLETKRLILRTPKISDAKEIRAQIDNIKISKWLLTVPYPYELKDAKWFINKSIEKSKKKEKDGYDWFIELKSEKKPIGGIGLHKVDKEQGVTSIGYWLGEDYWRQGIITEAVKAVLEFAFKKLKLRRAQLGIYSNNKGSIGVAKKLGFKLEGKLRKAAKTKSEGKIHDEEIYGLLKEEWKK